MQLQVVFIFFIFFHAKGEFSETPLLFKNNIFNIKRQRSYFKMTIYTSTYKSPIGTLTMASNGLSLCQLKLINQDKGIEIHNDSLPIFIETKHWLDVYFSGRNPDFSPLIELHGSDFLKKVWNTILGIDFGQTATYGEIAKQIGCKSAQAVGQAISRNPILLIVPCHRIIAANGKIGGFSAGIDKKIRLLENENQFSFNA
jgi:methylated-DNA-[protein]-cysteine S-methyltransferase